MDRSIFFKKVKNSKKYRRARDFLKDDDHMLFIKIEVCIVSGMIFLLVGINTSNVPGISSISAMIEYSRVMKFFFVVFLLSLFAIVDHHFRYHSHNFYLRLMNFFRFLTCVSLVAGVSVFDVYTYQNAHYTFVLLTCIFFFLGSVAEGKAIYDKEHLARSRRVYRSSHLKEEINTSDEDDNA